MGARASRLRIGLLAGICCALPFPAAAAEPHDPFYGVVVQQAALSELELAKMDRARVGTVRFVVPWGQVEPVEGTYNFDRLDERLAAIERSGARPLPVIYGQPAWLGHQREAPLHSDRARNAWQALLTTVAQRYGNGGELALADPEFRPVASWQVWNEPNLPSFWASEDPSAARYVELLQLSAPALLAGDPEAELIAAGLSPAPKGVPPRRYIREIYEEYVRLGTEPDFDQLALNPYAPSVRESRQQISKFTRLAAELAPGEPPSLLIAEIGWGSAGPKGQLVAGTKRTQAKRLRRAYRMLRNRRESWRISSVLWYAWRDLPADAGGCVFCAHIGLFDAAGEAKPAFRVFRDMRR